VLNDFEGKVVADDGPQSVKFIHLAMTHSPYLLDRTCRVAERAPPDGPENAAKCSLGAVAKILQRLKDLDLYD
uniref:hypothetical protein n=1 Tax=Klebsiella pneumoniae TaxID=573 RepID=UPI0019547544